MGSRARREGEVNVSDIETGWFALVIVLLIIVVALIVITALFIYASWRRGQREQTYESHIERLKQRIVSNEETIGRAIRLGLVDVLPPLIIGGEDKDNSNGNRDA